MPENYIEQEREWLNQNNDAYREAVQHLADPEYVRGLLRGVANKLADAMSYNPVNEPPHTAVYIIGQLQVRVEKLLTDLNFIDEYEERKSNLDETITNAESQDERTHGGDRFGYGDTQ